MTKMEKKQLKVIFLFHIPLLLHLRSYCIYFLFRIDVATTYSVV